MTEGDQAKGPAAWWPIAHRLHTAITLCFILYSTEGERNIAMEISKQRGKIWLRENEATIYTVVNGYRMADADEIASTPYKSSLVLRLCLQASFPSLDIEGCNLS